MAKAFNGDYDYESAIAAGLKPDETGHWPSKVPKTGLILKSSDHPTYQKTLDEERRLGYKVYKGYNGRYYSRKAKNAIDNPIIGQKSVGNEKQFKSVHEALFGHVEADLDSTPAASAIAQEPESGMLDYVIAPIKEGYKKLVIAYLGKPRFERITAASLHNTSYADKLILSLEITEALAGHVEKITDRASNLFNWKDFTRAFTSKFGITEGTYAENQAARYKEDPEFGKLSEAIGGIAKEIFEFMTIKKAVPGLTGVSTKALGGKELLKTIALNSVKSGTTFALASLSESALEKIESDRSHITEGIVKNFALGAGLSMLGYGIKYGAIGLNNKYSKVIQDMHLKDLASKLGKSPEQLKAMSKEDAMLAMDAASKAGDLTKKEIFLGRITLQNLEMEKASKAGKVYEDFYADAFPEIVKPTKFSAKKVATRDATSYTKSQIQTKLRVLGGYKIPDHTLAKNSEIVLDTLQSLNTEHRTLINKEFFSTSRKLAEHLSHQKGLLSTERKILQGFSKMTPVPNKLLGIEGRGSSFVSWDDVYRIGDNHYKKALDKSIKDTFVSVLKVFGTGSRKGSTLRLTDEASRYLHVLTKDMSKSKILEKRIDDVIGGSVDKTDPMLRTLYSDVRSFFTPGKTNAMALTRTELRDFQATLKNFGAVALDSAKSQQQYPVKIATKLAEDIMRANAKTAPGIIPLAERTESLSLKEKISSFITGPYDSWTTNVFKICGGDPEVAFKVINYAQASQRNVAKIEFDAGRFLYRTVLKSGVPGKVLHAPNTYKLASGETVTMTNFEAMTLWATFKDDGLQMDLMKKMGTEALDSVAPKVSQGCIIGKGTMKQFTNADVSKIFSSLDPNLQKMAHRMFKYINKEGRRIFTNWSKDVYGKTYKLNNNYFPMRSSRNIFDAVDDELDDYLLAMEGDAKYASIGGFQAGQALRDLISPFSARVSHDKALVIKPMNEAFANYFSNLSGLYKSVPYSVLNSTFKNKALNQEIFKRMGQPGVNILSNLLKGVEDFRGLYHYNHAMSRHALKGLDYVRGVNLMLNLNAVTNQAISGIMAASMFPKKAMALAANTSHKDALKIIKELSAYNASIGLRMSRYAGVHAQIEQMAMITDKVSKVEKVGMHAISAMDRATVSRTSILPAYYEGKLKGLTGEKLLKYASSKAQYSIDITAPTSTAFTIAPQQALMKHNAFYKALYMYTSPIFKAYNFMRINQVRLATNTISAKEAYRTYAAVGVLMPLTLYYKKKYQQYATRVVSRSIGGQEGAQFDAEDTTMKDDIAGIAFSILSQHPLGSVANGIITQNLYNMVTKKAQGNVSLSIDKGILAHAAQATMSIGNLVKELSETEYDSDTLASAMKALTDSVSIGAPYVGRIMKDAVPTKEKTQAFYTSLMHDAVKTKNAEKCQFAVSKLREYGLKTKDILKKAYDKREKDTKYDISFLYMNL